MKTKQSFEFSDLEIMDILADHLVKKGLIPDGKMWNLKCWAVRKHTFKPTGFNFVMDIEEIEKKVDNDGK